MNDTQYGFTSLLLKRGMAYTFLAITCLVLAISMGSCNLGANREIEQLQAQLDSMKSVDSSKDATIDEFFKSLNDIEMDLQMITQKGGSIMGNVKNISGDELSEDSRIGIEEDIVMINQMMAENHKKISRLEQKLKASNLQVAEFQRLLTNTKRELAERDSMVSTLMTRLEGLNFHIDSLQLTVQNLDSTNQQLTDSLTQQHYQLNQAWYAVGSADELVENRVLERKRTHKSVGKQYVLSASPNLSYCTEISMDSTKEIPVMSGKKGIAFVTSHPEGSYELVENEQGGVTKIVIKNPQDFWRTSRFLVMIIK